MPSNIKREAERSMFNLLFVSQVQRSLQGGINEYSIHCLPIARILQSYSLPSYFSTDTDMASIPQMTKSIYETGEGAFSDGQSQSALNSQKLQTHFKEETAAMGEECIIVGGNTSHDEIGRIIIIDTKVKPSYRTKVDDLAMERLSNNLEPILKDLRDHRRFVKTIVQATEDKL